MNKKALVVEDDVNIAELLMLYLEKDGFEVSIAHDGGKGVAMFSELQPDLVLLDIMMPVMDGMQVCREIRKTSSVPIIMLTAKGAVGDKVAGLDIGADDYITKPFNPLEVVARVKTQLRRAGRYNQSAAAPEDAAEYDIRGLIINRESHKCALYGRELALTPIEFSILWYLCSRQGRIVPSEELFEAVWKEKYLQNSSNTVMAHIARLREKMNEPPRNPKFIKTVWGVGYEIE